MTTYTISSAKIFRTAECTLADALLACHAASTDADGATAHVCHGPDIVAEIDHDVITLGRGGTALLTQTYAESIEFAGVSEENTATDDERIVTLQRALAGDTPSIIEWAEDFATIERAGYWEEQEVSA